MNTDNSQHVTIVDIKMPFWSMVVFMVKAAIASIPAFIILSIIGSLVFGLLAVVSRASMGA
jgi:hypothetical protein